MKKEEVLFRSELADIKLLSRGKVREIYDLGDSLLFVASDRISAFDVIMDQGIPNKGMILNLLSKFWFQNTSSIIQNHFITDNVDEYPENLKPFADQLKGRSMIVTKCKPLPVEFVVRGFVAGSGWKEYTQTGEVCGVKLPGGLKKYGRLSEPIFTPATKADEGHDENITFEQAAEILGLDTAQKLRDKSIEIFKWGQNFLDSIGIILADTKFEFGELPNGDLILIDEVMTPDSSRFWLKDTYQEGHEPENFDKQILRDWLESQDWDKEPPAPELPTEIIERTREKYIEIFNMITA